MALYAGTMSAIVQPLRTAMGVITMCTSSSMSSEDPIGEGGRKLRIGSPIIVVDTPAMLKTADSISCLKVNSGLVKPGDVGRIVAMKPKDVWAVRLSIGTYLIDGKYFKALDVDE